MKILIYSHGYPNAIEPYRNAFVRELIRCLPDDLDLRVMAPVPFFLDLRRGKTGSRIPYKTQEDLGSRKLIVYYPRYLLLPKNLLLPVIGLVEALCTLPILRLVKRKWKPDLIHANWAYPDGVAANYLSRWTGLPYMITEHQGSIGDLLGIEHYRRLISRAYQDSRALVLVSPSLCEPLRMVKGGLPRYYLIPNGINTGLYRLKIKSPFPHNMVYIGNFYQGKGLKFLIEALAILRDKSLELSLDIIGGGNEEAQMRNLCSKLGLEDRISFLGRKDPSEIPGLLQNYDFLVLPSLKESFGLVLIEAMATGLPVVATRSGGPQHIVSPETGIIVDPGSAEALAMGILDLRERWSSFDPKAIRDHVESKFNLQNNAAKLADLYRELYLAHTDSQLEGSPKIKVCHLSSVHPRKDIRIFHKECISLRAAGYTVHELIADGGKDELYKGVKIHAVAKINNRFWRMLISPLMVLVKALDQNADLYHFHDMELLPVGLILKAWGHKVIYDVHDSVPLQILGKFYIPLRYRRLLSFLMSKLEALLSSRMDGIVCADDKKSQRFRRIHKRVCTVHNYPMLQEFTGCSSSKRDPRAICYVGGITKVRGIMQNLDAIADMDLRLLLAGPFAPLSLEEECRKHPAWSKVEYKGVLDRTQVTELLCTASIGLVTIPPSNSHLDSLPTKLFEYMSAGIPVITSNIPHWKEIVERYACGLVVDASQPQEIKQAISYLLHNPIEAQEMGLRGKRAIESDLNWDTQIPILKALYKEILSK